MRSAIKYQDKHQNEVIFVTSIAHFSTLFLQKKRLSEFSGFRSTHNVSPYNQRFSFTGKEWCKSQWLAQRGLERGISETDYSYFGALYYDSDLSGLFLSVDPMADKYPSISPYAYCAWNPVKLVDPNGEEIDVSYLDESTRTRLINCLSTITGLSLYIEGNKLDYKKYKDGQPVFSSGSQTARIDLIDAIDKKNEDESNYVIQVGYSAVKCEGGTNSRSERRPRLFVLF